MLIASIAGQCQIRWIVVALMLLRDNVLDMERDVTSTLWQAAIFAAIGGPVANLATRLLVNHCDCLSRTTRAFALRIATRSMASTNSSYSVRSSSESVPKLAFSRNCSRRPTDCGSGESSTIRCATLAVKQLATGSRNRSKVEEDVAM